MILNSSELLKDLGYEYISYVDDREEPECVDVRFRDLLDIEPDSEFLKNILNERLYKHQMETYESLKEGKNIILMSGTGSGKTEAWLIYTLKHKVKTLAIYPTLALANDQIERIKEYCSSANLPVEVIDSKRREELLDELGSLARVSSYLGEMLILVTNPAFLFWDIKRWCNGPRNIMFLSKFLRDCRLIIIDEFDFYSPREAIILLTIIEILKDLLGLNPQVVILTATLGNPEEVAEILKQITDRETKIIKGKPFRVRNYTYIVLGKNLRRIYERLKSIPVRPPKEIKKALESYEEFEKEYYRVIEYFEALGYDIPKPEIDVIEILERYTYDDGVTLVFTRTIEDAEMYAKKLQSKVKEHLVATHHHLVDKAKRKEVEEKAREGTIKVIFTPKTLAQGIDIGTIVRIVHVGLPTSIKDFLQREGRKGRRGNIEFTETIIIPLSKWDRLLLSKGLDTYKKWLKLEREKVIINMDNEYRFLVSGLIKMKASLTKYSLGIKLNEKERDLLRRLKTLESRRWFNWNWERLNFYTFDPLHESVKRELDSGDLLDDLSNQEFVSRFQIGCFDYTNDKIVSEVIKKDNKIVGIRLSDLDSIKYEFYEEYEKYLSVISEWVEGWRDPVKDYIDGYLSSRVHLIPEVPSSGFGLAKFRPICTYWILESRRRRIRQIGDRPIVYRDVKLIELSKPVYGRFYDYTYGYFVDLDPEERADLIRLGLATLILVLRLKKNVPIDLISYDVLSLGNKAGIIIWENSCTGLLPKLDWNELTEDIRSFIPDELAEVLLCCIDDLAYTTFILNDCDWELAKFYALRTIDYLKFMNAIKVKIMGRELFIPKPSGDLKIATISALNLENYKIIGIFDGESVSFGYVIGDFISKVEFFEEFIRHLIDVINNNFKLIVLDKNQILNTLQECKQVSLVMLLQNSEVSELRNIVREKLGVDIVPLEALQRALGMERQTELSRVYEEFSKAKRLNRFEKFTEIAKEYILDDLKALYSIYLALSNW